MYVYEENNHVSKLNATNFVAIGQHQSSQDKNVDFSSYLMVDIHTTRVPTQKIDFTLK